MSGYEFSALEWLPHKIRDHAVAAIPGQPGLNPRDLSGAVVLIDGRRYCVIAVETQMIPDPTGRTFTLMVEPAA